ncbi:MAG: DegT/DnrJ/EryC1/StrS family aminotransferase, partial [Opitutales bacterium]
NPVGATGRPNHWLTCLLLDPTAGAPEPARIIDALDAVRIEARPVWKPMHQQPVFAGALTAGGEIADDIFARGLCLPSGSGLSDGQRARVIEVVRTCWNHR